MEYRKVKAKKRTLEEINKEADIDKVYKFNILLPNQRTVIVTIRHPKQEMPLEEFIHFVKAEYLRNVRQVESLVKPKRRIVWDSEKLYIKDAFENKITRKICLSNFKPHKCHILRLYDGSGTDADTFENMWDLTPDTDLLRELPEEYTYETALADLIDNSLQAVWSNGNNERRLISVDIGEDNIFIFDSGLGMDGSDENSIAKWGKMGASLHRSCKGRAIGGKPPYLVPFFGMFGYGGPIASMHLGRHVLVSSKTKRSKKVYTLHLEREALLSTSGSEQKWKTDGGIRDPSEDEIRKSPHGSFTKVEIYNLKMKGLNRSQLQYKLKDIYFPYIQCDEVFNTGKTTTPVEFQVNEVDLAEVEGGEFATTNLHSCNGPDFVLQLRFYFSENTATTNSQGSREYGEANARLKCVYFPIVQGKENIERILEKLETNGCGISECYENFSRVSIRRLGRLLPDARWGSLPFMDLRQKKGDKAQILKRCCFRVKCFIETDAGFSPTPSKTDLAHHHPFTTSLKNLGNKSFEKENEINIDIYRDGRQLNIIQLEREYQAWIIKMHDSYDAEIDHGDDQPIIVVGLDKKRLGISSEVGRVHQVITRKGTSWGSGQKIKVLKGACAGCHKNNVYATLEYILLDGLPGDAGGEAQIICRPLGLPAENGCILKDNDGNTSLDLRDSLSIPLNVIDSGKCLAVDNAEWNRQVDNQNQKAPSSIEILGAIYCQELDIDGVLPDDSPVYAGHIPPKEIVAVIRPARFISCSSKNLDQRYIIKDVLEMSMEVNFSSDAKDVRDRHLIYGERVAPSQRKGFNGLYIFHLEAKCPKLFCKAGVYIFSFCLRASSVIKSEKRVLVKASSEVGRWGLSGEQSPQFEVRVGSCFPPFSITCYDIYDNSIPFKYIPEVIVKLNLKGRIISYIDKVKVDFTSDMNLIFKDVLIESGELDKIRPGYDATLVVCSQDESFSVSLPCRVTPGALHHVKAQPRNFMDQVCPGLEISELVLEMFDEYGNHVREGLEVQFKLDGFLVQNQIGSKQKVDGIGCVDLSGLLKVTAGYGENVSLSVVSDNKEIFKKEFQTEKRELKIASVVPKFCAAGTQLENVVFEIVNNRGEVDETINNEEKYAQSHTLTIKSELSNTDGTVRYAIRHGRCMVPSIPLPKTEGNFCFLAAHSRYPEISLSIKIPIGPAPKLEHDYIGSHCSDGMTVPLQDASASKQVVESIIPDEQELVCDIHEIGERIGKCEESLKMLKDQKETIAQDLSLLRASFDPEVLNNLDYYPAKEVMIKLSESKGNTAAAIFCNPDRQILFEEPEISFEDDIVGLVALLGTVCDTKISRILAEYLGEEKMLAIVCRSYAAASALEKYDENGNVDRGHALHAIAMALGKSINGRFLAVCLEDMRPYPGDFIDGDPQRKLDLLDPTSPTGEKPLGFLGYAVNMINVHNHIMTSSGHGLRETLFYGLFGELQVYETREHLKYAFPYIKDGAVSLDGGIARGNGVISLGCCEPEISFPVVTLESQMNLSQASKEILNLIEEKESELRENLCHTARVTKTYDRARKNFQKKKDQLTKCIENKEALRRDFLLEYKSSNSNFSPF